MYAYIYIYIYIFIYLKYIDGRLLAVFRTFTLRKLECFKQAYALNTLAWNNKIGPRFYFVGF